MVVATWLPQGVAAASRKPPKDKVQDAFGRRIRALRDERQWTQAQLAEHSGLDVSYISQIERGRRDPSLSSLRALSRAFSLRLPEFFSEDGPAPHEVTARTIAAELEGLPAEVLPVVLEVVRQLRKLLPA
jgi:transcriptional regulator with XRE-family HTH domain